MMLSSANLFVCYASIYAEACGPNAIVICPKSLPPGESGLSWVRFKSLHLDCYALSDGCGTGPPKLGWLVRLQHGVLLVFAPSDGAVLGLRSPAGRFDSFTGYWKFATRRETWCGGQPRGLRAEVRAGRGRRR